MSAAHTGANRRESPFTEIQGEAALPEPNAPLKSESHFISLCSAPPAHPPFTQCVCAYNLNIEQRLSSSRLQSSVLVSMLSFFAGGVAPGRSQRRLPPIDAAIATLFRAENPLIEQPVQDQRSPP
jgi:hypothetical protein